MGLICATRWAEYADTREEDEMPARELLSRYNDVDVVIIEGYKTEGFDNIVVARSGVDRLRGKSSLDLVDGHTLALACNEALARQAFDAGFATRAININLPKGTGLFWQVLSGQTSLPPQGGQAPLWWFLLW